jgi:hypothetical protein
MMQLIVNVLGTLTAGLCAVLLLRAYADTRSLLIADIAIFHAVSLYSWRLGTAAVSMLLMVYGLILESDRS